MACEHDHGKAAVADQGERVMKRPDTPFPRHWIYYIAIKLVVIALAAAAAFYYFYV